MKAELTKPAPNFPPLITLVIPPTAPCASERPISKARAFPNILLAPPIQRAEPAVNPPINAPCKIFPPVAAALKAPIAAPVIAELIIPAVHGIQKAPTASVAINPT